MAAVSEVGRRIAAARAYAGIKSQAKLGELLGGVSQSTMQRLEAGGRGLKPYEQRTLLAAIAEVCELPAAWFTADFSRLDEISAPLDLADALTGPSPSPERTPARGDEARPSDGDSGRAA